MTLLDAIARADGIRPNTIPPEVKAEWVQEVDEMFAEMMGDQSVGSFPKNKELLQDRGYVWYVCAMIDLANKDTDFYMVDRARADEEIRAVMAKYRRANKPDGKASWRV